MMKTKIAYFILLATATISCLVINNSKLINIISTLEKIKGEELLASETAKAVTPRPDQLNRKRNSQAS